LRSAKRSTATARPGQRAALLEADVDAGDQVDRPEAVGELDPAGELGL
jgi:hypothetical protein